MKSPSRPAVGANFLWAQPSADEIQFDELEGMQRARFESADQEEKFQTELKPVGGGERSRCRHCMRIYHPPHGMGLPEGRLAAE